MKTLFNNLFWENLRIYRIWRGYGPAFFLELEQINPVSEKLFGGFALMNCQTYIDQGQRNIFNYDISGPYQDSLLFPINGLKILKVTVGKKNSLTIEITNNYKIRVGLASQHSNYATQKDCWDFHINSIDSKNYYVFYEDHIEFKIFGIDFKNEIKSEINPAHYLDETLQDYEIRCLKIHQNYPKKTKL